MIDRVPASIQVPIEHDGHNGGTKSHDLVTVEEPLEIRIIHGKKRERLSLSVTMRTPGSDEELAVGFLKGEGIIDNSDDILGVHPVGSPSIDKGLINIVEVVLEPHHAFDPDTLTRHTYTSSRCGICGKTSLDAIAVAVGPRSPYQLPISESDLHALPTKLHIKQVEFERTGGLHAAATFTSDGEIEKIREDVGRHNAVDKLVGSYLLESKMKMLSQRGLLLSGRASFELIQKAALAHISFVAAIGPPSSLAIELAEEQNITLIGFLRHDRFNRYSGMGKGQ